MSGAFFHLHQNGTKCLHPSPLGSGDWVTNQDGTVAEKEAYYPWGGNWVTAAPGAYDNRFAGMQPRDGYTGLDATQFRMYESRLGRWMSPDPLGGDVTNPQSLNRYAYVLNNPATLTDPLGLDAGDQMNCTADDRAVIHCYPTHSPPDRVSNGPNDAISALIAGDSGACVYRTGMFSFLMWGCNPGGTLTRWQAAPKPASEPSLQPSRIATVNRCAAGLANNLSVASLAGLNNVLVVRTLFSNNVSSVSELVFGSNPNEYVPAGASLTANRYAGSALIRAGSGLGSVEVNQGFQTVFTTVAPTALEETAVGGVAVGGLQLAGKLLNAAAPAQLLYDTGVYIGALAVCSEQ